ncbi:hypothetical protein [Rhodospirillum sp. A1_3_36]|uniref:hypothetical protein n=1 Tax=Rhodospirillum sp. A1_3_36 TaxID=3391666 RepID=UPI0039A67126
MTRFRFLPSALHLSLLVVVLSLALVGGAPPFQALAAEEGGSQKDKITKRPRYDAALSGGTVIQLDTMWIPMVVSGDRRQYVGMTVHLMPEQGKEAEACYVTPWVTEALIFYFNSHGMSPQERQDLDNKDFVKALSAVVDKVAKPGVFREVKVIDAPPAKQDANNAELSLICI